MAEEDTVMAEEEVASKENEENKPELVPEEFFRKCDVGDKIFVKEDGVWQEVLVKYKHTSKLKLLLDKTWMFVDPKNMSLTKPADYCKPRKEAKYESSSYTGSYAPGASYGGYPYSYIRRNQRAVPPSKPSHGFAGLRNQGATCYLNSLLQTFFMTLELRQAIFQWSFDSNKDGKDESRCMTLQLQRLFSRLQYGKQGATGTTDLTKSFGWTGADVFQQHDVVELAQLLLDFMRENSHDERLTSVVSQFRCEITDYIECQACSKSRNKKQPLVGIPLPIEAKEITTLDAAFRKYADFEILQDGNAVTCPSCDSKQPHKKGVSFSRFGKFLAVQLGRWTLNYQTFQREKIHKVIEFGEQLDVAPYIGETEPVIYDLYSMMIHRGGAYGGHYFAYIKDFESGKWLEFNDSTVREIPAEEFKTIMSREYAESSSNDHWKRESPLVGAYMLVYRARSDENMMSVSDDLVPVDMKKLLDEEDAKWEQKRNEFYLYVFFERQQEDIVFDPEVPLKEQMDKIWKTMNISQIPAEENWRIRRVERGAPSRVYTDLSKGFADLNLTAGDEIVLETKKPGADFSDVKVEMRKFNVVSMNTETMQRNENKTVEVAKDGTSGNLRQAIAEQFNWDPQFVKMFGVYKAKGMDPCMEALDMDDFQIGGTSFNQTDEIWVQLVDRPFADVDETLIQNLWESQRHLITIRFNKLQNLDDATECLEIDDRIPTKELRARIALHLGVDPDSFKLRKPNSHQEIKDGDKLVCDLNLHPKTVILQPGKPMQKGMWNVTIHLDTKVPGEERFEPLFRLVVGETMTRQELAELIIKTADSDSKGLPPPELMRFRHLHRERLHDFVPTNGTLKQGFKGLSEGYDIVIEPVSEPEDLKPSDLILQLTKFHPGNGSCEQARELIVSSTSKIKSELKDAILKTIGDDVPAEYLKYCVTRSVGWHGSMNNQLDWDLNEVNENHTTGKWRLKSGMIILYKDDREAPPEERESDERPDHSGSAASAAANVMHMGRSIYNSGGAAGWKRHRPVERGLKILTAQEQVDREKQQQDRNEYKSQDDSTVMGPHLPPHYDSARSHSA